MDEKISTAAEEKNNRARKNLGGKYLTFTLGHEEYGVNILLVKEIIGIMEITVIPDMPPYAKGVVNLRGRVIPIIDLRLRFHMAAREFDDRTCIIVMEVSAPQDEFRIGIIVDAVSEVANIAEKDIEPPPEFGTSQGDQQMNSLNILGIAKINDRVKILLDIERVIKGAETATLQEAFPKRED